MPLMLMSPAIPPGGRIPAQYTCNGSDISPPLAWSGVPSGTRSLVLTLVDPDAPGGLFHHWAAFDIPANWQGLPAGYGRGRAADGFREATNDFGRVGYGGPCPPPGGGAHHYRFELMALSRPALDPDPGSAGAVMTAAAPYVIARATLTGTYQR